MPFKQKNKNKNNNYGDSLKGCFRCIRSSVNDKGCLTNKKSCNLTFFESI